MHPAFLGGGAEAVGLWTAQALCSDHDVTLFSFSGVDFNRLNAYYGTGLNDHCVKVVNPSPGPVGRWMGRSIRLLSGRQLLLSHCFRQVAHDFDFAVSTFNELDMGARGLQYIHYPIFSSEARSVRGEVAYPDSPLRNAVVAATKVVLGARDARVRGNVMIANSRWTAEVVRRVYGLVPRVIYPPVFLPCAPVDRTRRRAGFICISRIVEEKQVFRAIQIVEGVRRAGFDIGLTIVGGQSSSNDPTVSRAVERIQASRRSWLDVRFNLTKAELTTLLVQFRYGLHVRDNEQFGIAVAEMTAAGCIPFVPASGGSREVVGHEPMLLFRSVDDAVARICRVLKSESLQERLSLHVQACSQQFGAERFMTEIRDVILTALEEARGRDG